VVGTPVFEGVGEMTQTPAGWRGEEMEADEEEEFVEEELVPTKKSACAKTAGIVELTMRGRNQRGAASKDTPSLADDEATPGALLLAGRRRGKQVDSNVEEGSGGIPKPKARLLRGKNSKAVEGSDKVHLRRSYFILSVDAGIVWHFQDGVLPKTRKSKTEEREELSEQVSVIPLVCIDIGYSYNDVQATGQASKTKTSKPKTKNVQPTEEDDSKDPAPIVPAKPAAHRGHKAVKESGTTTNEDIHSLAEDDSKVEPPTKAPARRGRKPAIEPGTSAIKEQQHAPLAKPGRKTRTTKQTAEQLDPDVPVNTTRKGHTKGDSAGTDANAGGSRDRGCS
jgi:hypothetical protein